MGKSSLVAAAMIVAVALTSSGLLHAQASSPTTIRLRLFGGLPNLPVFVGQERGLFAKENLRLDVVQTPDSDSLRKGLAEGVFDVAVGGIDNALAMVDVAGADAVVVLGGDSAMNSLIVQPDVQSIADLRGRQLIVDAPNTAYALVARKILLRSGLVAGRDYTLTPTGGTMRRFQLLQENSAYGGSMLNPPFSIQAEKLGFRNLGSLVRLIGPYQGTGTFVMRPWARANRATLERYIRGYVEAVRWILAPANQREVLAFIAARYQLPGDIAAASYQVATDREEGLARDARLNIEGLRNVLALRAELERNGAKPESAERYYDLTYYQRAVATLRR